MIKLMISDAHGPVECQLAVQHLLNHLLARARNAGLCASAEALHAAPHGLHSAILVLDGHGAEAFTQDWMGSVQWIWSSRLRPKHRRKNWFVGIFRIEEAAQPALGTLRIDTCKAGGKGGQHVNKTRSAVRITDTASGLSVKAQDERSQARNKALALQRLAAKHAARHNAGQDAEKRSRQRRHHDVARGGAVKIFVGDDFREK